jgi:hypothetical protein
MKPPRVLFACLVLASWGCRDRDVAALRPYANIRAGSVIILRTKTEGNDFTTFPVRKMDLIMTNECVLLEINDGTVVVSNSRWGNLGFAGRMVSSIEVKEAASPPPNVEPKR